MNLAIIKRFLNTLKRGWGMLFRALFICSIGVIAYLWMDPLSIRSFAKLTLSNVANSLLPRQLSFTASYGSSIFHLEKDRNFTANGQFRRIRHFGSIHSDGFRNDESFVTSSERKSLLPR
jgi:hypothetical protein